MSINVSSQANSDDLGVWIKPFDVCFLGLHSDGTVRHVLGPVDTILTQPPAQILGLSWSTLVERYADEPVRRGLNYAWQAIAGQGVAPAYWPPYLPFRSGVSACLRPVQDDPIIAFAAQLSTQVGCRLDDLFGHSMTQVMERVVRLGQHVFRGIDGPLTDKQVKEVGSVVGYTENLKQLLEDMRSELFAPLTVAPIPLSLSNLLTFSERDFSNRRVVTHQLSIHCQWSSVTVYCYPAVRDTVRRLLESLVVGIALQSAIKLSDHVENQDQTVRVEIRYRSQEPALQVDHRIEPLALFDPARFGPVKPIQGLVTAAQSCLKPVNGQVWAEPCQAEDANASIVLLLPRWQGPVPD